MFQDLLAVLSGSVVGFSLSLLGGGGSILAVPLLLYVVGVRAPQIAIGTSALAVSLNACASLVSHACAGNVRWREGITFASVGILGALVGSTLSMLMDAQKLLVWFAALMLMVALLMLRPARIDGLRGDEVPVSYFRLAAAGLGAGTLSGFFGIGGGFLIVPALILASGMSIMAAIGTSLVSIAVFGMTTAANYASSDFIDWRIASAFTVGGVGGSLLGTRLAQRLSRFRGCLNALFAGSVILVALVILYNCWSG
jgi:uncharacterized membrane protein YfcA